MSAEKVWWYAKGGEQFGPHTSSELKTLVSTGQFGPDDMVWKEGLSNWLQASSVKGLFTENSNGFPPIDPCDIRPSLESASSSKKPHTIMRTASRIALWVAGAFIGLIVLIAIVGQNKEDGVLYSRQTPTTYNQCEKLCKEAENDCYQSNDYRSKDAELGISFNCGFKYGVCESQCAKKFNH